MLSAAYASPAESPAAIVDTSTTYIDVTNVWQNHYTVNGFTNSGSPDPSEIFKIRYRVINGTIEQFSMPYVGYAHQIQANVTSSGDGLLEIRFPKNYPSANIDGGGEAVFFIDEQETFPAGREGTDCFYEYSFPFSGSAVVHVSWVDFLTNEPFRGVEVPKTCIPETTVHDVVKKNGTITPLHQLNAGVRFDEVVCTAGFELVTSPTGKPYCATPASAEILKERWK
jgi:hypothetical protein